MPKARVIPYGGLGGVIYPERGEAGDRSDVSIATEANLSCSEQQRRLPPINILGTPNDLCTSPSQASAVSSLRFGDLLTPKTSNDWCRSQSVVGNESNSVASPITPRFNSDELAEIYCSPPETPASSRPWKDSLPVELPGSLLLPSQGFPQTNPISPPPSLQRIRRDTEDSTSSSVPTLSTSPSTDADTMDALRSWATPLKKANQFGDSAMPTYIIGNRLTEGPQISKPFSAMNIEELLTVLPECNSLVVAQLWIPAARAQFQRMIALLNEAGEIKLGSSLDQVALHQVCTSAMTRAPD